MANQALHLTIIDAEKKVYDGDIKAFSSKNDSGPFDILPFHANFISIIHENIVIHEASKNKKEIPIKTAVLKALENNLTVFLGIGDIELTNEEIEGASTSPSHMQKKDNNQKAQVPAGSQQAQQQQAAA